jgi:hypothetical protein
MGWRMGFGEEYMHQWETYYFGLNADDRNEYKVKFPEPESWPRWYQIIEQIHQTRIEDEIYFANLKSQGKPPK